MLKDLLRMPWSKKVKDVLIVFEKLRLYGYIARGKSEASFNQTADEQA